MRLTSDSPHRVAADIVYRDPLYPMNNALRFLQPIARLLTSWVCMVFGIMLVPIACNFVASSFGNGPFQKGNAQPIAADEASLVRIPLPLDGNSDARILRSLQEIAVSAKGDKRPTVVLLFEERSNDRRDESETLLGGKAIGGTTSFERALSLARWLTGPQGIRLRTIAYLPKSIEGHSVLVALACEEIAMAPDATLGNAVANEPKLDSTVRQAYLEVNGRRQAFPESAVVSMLDAAQSLYQVDLVEGEQRFLLEDALKPLKDEGKAWGEKQITLSGQVGVFTGLQLRQWRWIAHAIRKPEELAKGLGLSKAPKEHAMLSGPWNPVVFQVRGIVNTRMVNQFIRGLEEAMKDPAVNLAMIEIDSPGGHLSESLRLAHYLASLEPQRIRTIGLISRQARGDAALIALACNSLFMAQDATLGGAGDASISPENILDLLPSFEELAQKTGRNVGELHGPVCPELATYLYSTAEGATRWSAEEVMLLTDDAGDWTKGELLQVGQGFSAPKALELRWIQGILPDLQAIASEMEIEKLPDPQRSNSVENFVQRLADLPWLPSMLIMIGIIAFMTEMSTPGIGVPGFISALCFLVFFWIRFLNGTVEWLEISLFIGGILFVSFELFVLPGFGIFGIGGICMLLAGLILASQTFIWPTNEYQLNEMAWNMGQVAATLLAICIGLFMIRNQLENLPMFRWMKLAPAGVDDVEALDQRESIVHWQHLEGKVGVTTTKCVPSGKARVGDSVVNVVSEGGLIEADQAVRVIAVRGNLVVVEPIG